MTEISRAANLSKEYTNYSCRATTVHVLDEAEFPSRHIMSITGHISETSLKTYSGKPSENTKKRMSKVISEKTLGVSEKTETLGAKTAHSTTGLLKPTTLPSNIDFLSLSQSNITIEHDSGTAFGNSFELQALSSLQTETVLNDMLPDNDGVDDFLKSLDIPAQETCINVPISKSMCQFPVPMITNCQNITINYKIFP
jgi:hypothetical protein